VCNFAQIRSGGECRVWYVLAWRNLLCSELAKCLFSKNTPGGVGRDVPTNYGLPWVPHY